MNTQTVLITIGATAVAACGAAVGLGVLLTRKVGGWKSGRFQKVISVDGHTIRLANTPEAAHGGQFVIRYPGGAARVGNVIRTDNHSVTRELLSITAGIDDGTTVRWAGETHVELSEIGPYEAVTIDGPAGPCPAWLFGDPDADTWAIHIHGVRADRHNAMRTVPATLDSGLASLVVSYRGDGDAPAVRGGVASLGWSEWPDVDAAIRYAIDRGASNVILVGWSMGASLALLTTERSSLRDRIAGLILISPTSDWRAIITHGARRRRLPSAAAKLGQIMLSNRFLSRVAGLDGPVDLDALDWTVPGRLQVPTLVIHSPSDRTVPFRATEQFRASGGAFVTLHSVADADHSWEHNIDPAGVDTAITEWLEMVVVP